ncbi:hypothetical protein Leryth_016485 [Lithospermum erythrorhizon]|nr:hypothetical protein Leryth_016485 [Lithospermum erythrorhizon]
MSTRRRHHHLTPTVLLLLLLLPITLSLPFPKKKVQIKGPIKTIVILVMENRSFDHILGWLKQTRPDINGLSGSEFNHLNSSDPNSKKIRVSNSALYVESDPGHSIQAIKEQIFGSNTTQIPDPAPMNGFAQQAYTMGVPGLEKTVMSGFKPELLPVYTELVNEFAVFDKWFSSVPASTQPNRFYIHSSTSHGASSNRFVKEVYESLRASPQWDQMALFITYDEHGGFYDHVATPVNGVPNPDGIIGPEPFYFRFERLGVRVPTLLISPWIDKGTVIHEPSGPTPTSQFEHSSIPATVKKLFNLKSNFLTKRDAWAGTFDKYFSIRKTPRDDCPETLPEVTMSLRPTGPKEDAKLTEFQIELIQLASQLNGDYVLNSYPDIGKSMTAGEANKYVEDAVERFLEAGRAALKAGANDSAIVTMKPSLTSRTSGSDRGYLEAY